ncbi:hypothetical protein PAXINDRAFT_99957, partial [Paxillus involutus ATCC 200175]
MLMEYRRHSEQVPADLGCSALETAFIELDLTTSDCKIAYDRVEKWARTEKAPFNINFAPFRPIGAIAAGNCFVLKSSELSSKTSCLIDTDESRLFIAPTVVHSVKGDDSLELFGPVLPVVPVKDLDAAIEFINARGYPLALYVFSHDASSKNNVFDNTQSGSAVANDTLVHCATDGFPFGGIGASGSGSHTRKFTFDMFTHLRSCSILHPGSIRFSEAPYSVNFSLR